MSHLLYNNKSTPKYISDLSNTTSSTHSSSNNGIMTLTVRNDTLENLAGGDGQYAPLQVNDVGALYTSVHSSALPTGAATETKQDTMITSLQLLDNAVDGNYLNTNMNIQGVDVDGNSGNKSAQTQRVCIADDDTNILSIKNNINNVVGTSGSTGPSNVLSIGGTESGGNIREVLVDSDGHLQVDILSGGGTNPSIKVDDVAFTLGSDSVTMIGGFAGTQSVNANDSAALACGTDGHLYVTSSVNTGTSTTLQATGGVNALDGSSGRHIDATAYTNNSADLQISSNHFYKDITIYGYTKSSSAKLHFAVGTTTTVANHIIMSDYATLTTKGSEYHFVHSLKDCPFRYVSIYNSDSSDTGDTLLNYIISTHS